MENLTSEKLTVPLICGTNSRQHQQFYELLADVLQSIAATEQISQAA